MKGRRTMEGEKMERLTHKRVNGIREGYWSPNKKQELIDRLAAYENTGVDPDQIQDLKERNVGIPLEDIRGNKDKGHLRFGTCPSCRRRVSDVEGGNFCQNCGQRLKWEER